MGRYEDENPVDEVFRHIVSLWVAQLEHARKDKRTRFGLAADEAMAFYNGPKTWDELMHPGIVEGSDFPDPAFKISVNKVFEFVDIFGPALYYENPVRTVKPRVPVDVPPDFFPDPMVYESLFNDEQMRLQVDAVKSSLIGAYLNWTPHEYRLAEESRAAINEALIKGRSAIWTELYTPPGSKMSVVKSYWDSVDHLFVDPDAPSLDKAAWIARQCCHPYWQVERDYGLPPGTLKQAANSESQGRQADFVSNPDEQDERRRGKSNDLIRYYKIWSKMGVGGRLPGCKKDYGKAFEVFGDYAYFVVAEGVPYFLNLPPHVMNDPSFSADPDQVFARTAWPTPYWSKDGWPMSCLDFHPVPNSPWPIPHIKAGIGELKAMNWIISFMVGHLHNSSRDFVVIDKSANEETKATVLGGKDLELIELDLSNNKSVQEVIQFLQHPQMNGDIWKVIEALEALFDKRVGLTELMYGTTEVQVRSAEEASIKNQNMNVRPADMAKQVESWQSMIAAKEAMCARYHLSGEDTRPVLGSLGGYAWDAYVTTKDVQIAAHELEYQIEAGSTQKPNKDFEVRQMTEAMQTVMPVFQAYAQQTGDVSPLNNLLSDWAKSRDLDPNRYVLQAMPPPLPPDQAAGGPAAPQQQPTENPVQQG